METKGEFSLVVKKRKIPLRMCIGCHEMKPKKELIRIVKAQDNTVTIDLTGKKAGRGAYICFNIDCLEKAKKGRKLDRAFEYSIASNIYDNLREELENINDK